MPNSTDTKVSETHILNNTPSLDVPTLDISGRTEGYHHTQSESLGKGSRLITTHSYSPHFIPTKPTLKME